MNCQKLVQGHDDIMMFEFSPKQKKQSRVNCLRLFFGIQERKECRKQLITIIPQKERELTQKKQNSKDEPVLFKCPHSLARIIKTRKRNFRLLAFT